MVQVSGVFTKAERAERNHPPHPPLGGVGVGVVAPVKPAKSDAAEWVRANLPICSAFSAEVKAAFGDCRLTFASEQGHVIGKPAADPAFTVTGEALIASLTKRKAAK